MIDTDYDEESFFVRHCYFTGGNDPYKRLKTALKADIETLTAESKMSARILSLLPLGVFLLINLINREFMAPMLASNTGVLMFVFAAFSVMMGYWMMMKIADIDI